MDDPTYLSIMEPVTTGMTEPISPATTDPSPPQSPVTEFFENHDLFSRVHAAIAHTRSCHLRGTTPITCNNFLIPTSDAETLALAHDAETKGLASFIYGSPEVECYSIGIPPRPRYFLEQNIPWWHGLSRAEMRVGDVRTNAQVRVAERAEAQKAERRMQSERRVNGKFRKERDTLRVGLERQVLGLPMDGTISDEGLARARKDHAEELKEVLRVCGEYVGIEEEIEKDEGEIEQEEEEATAQPKPSRRKRVADQAEDENENTAPKKRRTSAQKQPRTSNPRTPKTPPRRKEPKLPAPQEESQEISRPGDT
jgi:hypothetical protein